MTAVSTAPPRLLRPATASDIEAIAAPVARRLAARPTWGTCRRSWRSTAGWPTCGTGWARTSAPSASSRARTGVDGFVTVHGDEVEQLYVAPEARGAGVADRLLAEAERDIAEHHDGPGWPSWRPMPERGGSTPAGAGSTPGR